MRLGISIEAMRAGVSRMFICSQHRDLAAVEIDGGAMQPGRAGRDNESRKVGDVLHLAESYDAGLARQPLAHCVLGLARALDLGADTPPLPLCLNQAGMDAVDL